MLWLSRSDGRDADGHPLPWTVRAAIDVPLGPGQFVEFGECSLDGTWGTGVAAVVTGEVDDSNDHVDVAAWSFDVATESITAIDPVRVSCPVIS